MRNRHGLGDGLRYLPLICAIGYATLALAVEPGEPVWLEPGATVVRELAGKESHEYRFRLLKDQYARVVVEQRSINVAVACFGPDGKLVLDADTYLAGEPETVEMIAGGSGDYRLRVTSTYPAAPIGSYAVTLGQPEAATGRHRHRVAASLAYSKGAKASATGTREGIKELISSLEDALPHWQAIGDSFEEARTLYGLGSAHAQLGDRQKALDYSTRALPAARASRDPRSEGWALHYLAEFHNNFGDKRKAVEYGGQALPMMRAAGDRGGEGAVLNGLGTAYARTGEKRKALECFEQAEKVMRDLQDPGRLASVAGNIGVTYSDLGEYRRALESHEHALALQRQTGNRGGEAITLNNIGTVYSSMAEYQKALDAHTAALEINRLIDRRWSIAINLHNIAWIYANLGDRQRALNYYREALEILREVKDQFSLAHTINSLAELHADAGENRKALELHTEGLALRRSVGDPVGEAVSLDNIGRIYSRLGEREKARDHFERAIVLLRASGDRRKLAGALRDMGALMRDEGKLVPARAYLEEGLAMSRAIQDRRGEADTMAEMARLERDGGDLTTAHERADQALGALESLRLAVISPTLRASLFASAREIKDLEVEVLMRLDEQNPGQGYAAAALSVVERGRARSLLELLGESGAEIRRDADPALLDRERELARLIAGKAERQIRLLSGKHSEADAAALGKELDTLTAELDQVRSRIRDKSPQYAELTQPAPLNLREIQAQVLDEDTLLLEYSLGVNRSFVWAVTERSAEAFALPPRAEIEEAARRVYDLLTARNRRLPNETAAARAARLGAAGEAYFAAAAKAAQMLLAPVADRLGNKRLLIVGEGVLQYLPFAALADPISESSPLMVKHEIVIAPSASAVAVLRRETAGRRPAEKALAVLADPVFSADDARIAGNPHPAAQAATRDFVRLRFSRLEAEEIARLFPAARTLKALDFDASRETVLNPEFGRHRIVHFATHGVLNNERPELSGVVLSQVDRAGRPQNGWLRLYEVYNLRLASDLVVLSACQTALGGEINGEGLMGLTRGFLYAGAARVVSSLWEVDDRTSAQLMKRFYQGMLVRGERPAAALRAAQVAMWQTRGWDAPYYWGAYTLQGEWR